MEIKQGKLAYIIWSDNGGRMGDIRYNHRHGQWEFESWSYNLNYKEMIKITEKLKELTNNEP